MANRLSWIVLSQLVLPVAVAQLPPVPPTDDTADKKPRLYLAERVRALGTIMEGDKVTADWLLENHGNADLIIETTSSDCGCAIVKLADADKVIRPGASLRLKVVFDSTRRRGPQQKHVTVVSNDPTTPKLRLEIKAKVDYLYEVVPSTLLNLQMLRRGETAAKTLDIVPGPGRSAIEILDVKLDDNSPLTCTYEPLEAKSGTGQRFRFMVDKDAALGKVRAVATVRLKVGAVERQREVPIRGEVIGDLDVNPKVVDATRQTSMRGQELAPVTVRSTNRTAFEILGTSAGLWLDVRVERVKTGPPGTNYRFLITIRDDALSGPFGATLEIQTSSVDQPVISVPVFGIVAPPIYIDPPIILLRQDGTPAGTHRRVRIKASPREVLEITNIECADKAVEATIDHEASRGRRHLLFLDVRLIGRPPAGTHETSLVLRTNIKSAERLEVPVRIDVPE